MECTLQENLMIDPGPVSTSRTEAANSFPDYLYHYTSHENLKKIFSDGKIIASSSKAGNFHGPGVYLTALAPDLGRRRIWWNNKGGTSPFTTVFLPPFGNTDVNTTECYLKLKTDRLFSKLQNVQLEQGRGRDIWKYNGDILLEGTDLWYTFGFVDERGRTMAQLNQMHGKDGWSHSIKELTIDSAEETEPGKYCVYASANIRMELANGRYHEDIGTGVTEGLPSMAVQLKVQAKHDAIRDGLKRAAEYFGFPEDFGCRTPHRSGGSTSLKDLITPSKTETFNQLTDDTNREPIGENILYLIPTGLVAYVCRTSHHRPHDV